MRPIALQLILGLCLTLAAPLHAREAVDAVMGRASATPGAWASAPHMVYGKPPADPAKIRCTPDGASCIETAQYVPDTCRAIEVQAAAHGLDPHFLARLLWRESLFDPAAVSPAGAMGIAQFMPETARIVGLSDPYNPAEAILISARYLAQLSRDFGNIGLAAVAYNGGENRAARFVGANGRLPYETQDYVLAITGHAAEDWRDEPPQTLDLRLDKEKPFQEACVTLASARKIKEFATPERVWPWGVIVATHPSRAGAQKLSARLTSQLRPALKGKRVGYVQIKLRGATRRVWSAQIGWDNRNDANAFCNMLRGYGGRCMVLKN